MLFDKEGILNIDELVAQPADIQENNGRSDRNRRRADKSG